MLAWVACIAVDAIYVSSKGTDSAPGASSRPVATLARAVALARRSGAHRIVVRSGEYRLPATLDLTDADSGLTIEAAPGAPPLLTGSVRVPDAAWHRVVDADVQRRATELNPKAVVWEFSVANVPGATLTPFVPFGFSRPVAAGPSELFAQGQPLTLARWPNADFTKIKAIRELGNGEEDANAPKRRPIFTALTDRAKSWRTPTNAWLFGYWRFDWADETIQIHAVDPGTGEITLESPHTFGLAEGASFYALNVPEELDQIGEYYVDQTAGRVRVVTAGPRPTGYRWTCLGDPLVRVNRASRITLRGLDFGYSRGEGLVVENGMEVRAEGCRFFNLGERGAVFNDGYRSGLVGCDLWNLGEGGVVLSGGDRQTLKPAELYVENCDIHHYQRRTQTYRPGVAIYGVGNRVSHCAIHDAPHSAIIFGGNDHVIERSEFYRTIAKTGDGGVIYTGRDWTARGTVIRDNYLHDNIGLRQWENAIYFDDLASGLTAKNNLIERCHWGFLIGGGRDNILEGNLLVDCKQAFQCDARGLGWAAKSRPTMEERLLAVPYQSEPWRTRYPSLLKILEEDPMAPMGNIVRGNVLVNSGKLMDATEAPFAKTATYAGNVETKTRPKWSVRDAGTNRVKRYH